MGLFDALFRRPRRVTDAGSTMELSQEMGGMLFRVANIQGVGQRERQEDSFAVLNAANPGQRERQGLFAVVCDGMGGMEDGKLASQCAVETFLELFQNRNPDLPMPKWMEACAHTISDYVFQRFSGASGTTLVAVHIQDQMLHWVSVGDSAIFLLRDGGVFQLNQEHTFLNELYARELEQEVICKARAEQDEDARRLTSFVGINHLENVDQSLQPLPLRKGDGLLLCSDGVSGVLTPAELLEVMSLEPEEGCALLETMILEKQVPAQDNYTGILISCEER